MSIQWLEPDGTGITLTAAYTYLAGVLLLIAAYAAWRWWYTRR
jgi:hypothetical protein